MLGGPKKPLLALGVEEYVDNGEKIRFSLKDVGADIRSCDQTYGPS
jgi:hypothetical protein